MALVDCIFMKHFCAEARRGGVDFKHLRAVECGSELQRAARMFLATKKPADTHRGF